MGKAYSTISEVLDFGTYISKVILYPEQELRGAQPQAEQFRVKVTRRLRSEDFPWPEFMGERPSFPMEGERQILAAYLADEDGEACEDGGCIALELACDPRDGLGAIMRFNGKFNTFVDADYEIDLLTPLSVSQGEIALCKFSENRGNRILLGDLLREEEHKDPEISLRYSFYEPENLAKGEQIPLLIWLHGMGEGGEDTKIAAVGNKVVNLISPEIQEIFGGRAYLLVPQAPTWWMDPGDGKSLADDGRTCYAEPLRWLIEDFMEKHPQTDRGRVYLGGDSNGGYMTVNMVIRYPQLFAAAFPVCEAYRDEALTQEAIERLAQVPLWFTAAQNDPVVPVKDYVVPTYRRLKEAGAQVHLTLWDKVEDHTGRYRKEDGSPYEYNGHWSWIPMLNNENRVDYDGEPVLVNGREATMLEWLAAQRKEG
ncbi:MAG: prolyl oligopeptidase family serine peptidase [Eubacteriales bacterium]|nr:prolyl oligopeptidase family serine peptidase [Eubacteriales bacterium]